MLINSAVFFSNNVLISLRLEHSVVVSVVDGKCAEKVPPARAHRSQAFGTFVVSLSGITNGVSATVGFACSKPEF